MNFDEYCKTHIFENNINDFDGKKQSYAKKQNVDFEQNNINDTISKYQNYTQADLMAALVDEANKQKRAGNLNQEQLSKLANTIRPMLDANQQTRFDEILKIIK